MKHHGGANQELQLSDRGHRDAKFARWFVADDYNGLSVLVFQWHGRGRCAPAIGDGRARTRCRATLRWRPVTVEEQKHSAREGQKRGDKDDNINEELELIARHALIIGACAGRPGAQPTNRASLQTNRSPMDTGRKSMERRRGLTQSLTSGARKAGAPHAVRSTIWGWHIKCPLRPRPVRA